MQAAKSCIRAGVVRELEGFQVISLSPPPGACFSSCLPMLPTTRVSLNWVLSPCALMVPSNTLAKYLYDRIDRGRLFW